MNKRFERYIPPTLTVIIFALIAGTLSWTARRNYKEFADFKREAITRSVAASSHEIGLLLSDLHRRLNLVVTEHSSQIETLARSPGDQRGFRDFAGYIRRHFPGSRGLALADYSGTVRYRDMQISAPCRSALHSFARGQLDYGVVLDAEHGRLRINVMVSWRARGVKRGVLLVRFTPRWLLVPLLRNAALTGHRLVLLGGEAAVGTELIASSTFENPSSVERLTAADYARIIASQPIAGMRWTLVDIPGANAHSIPAARERNQVLIALAGIGLLWVALTVVLRRTDSERLAAERALLDSYGQLERRVAERTQALRQSNEGLEREVTERRRSEWLRAGQQEFLRLVAEGRSLPATFDRLARHVENRLSDVRCAFMVRDEKNNVLRLMAAPSLPVGFTAELALVPISESGPVCAVAADRGAAVLVRDTCDGPIAQRMRPAFEAAGIAAGWAQPVFGAGGRVLGVISMFYSAPREATADESEIMAMLVDVVGIAIQRCRAEAQMRKLSSAIEQTDDLVVITDRHGVIEYVNRAFLATTGFAREEVLGHTPSINKSGMYESEYYHNLWETILRGEAFRDVVINRRHNGSLYYEEKTISPLKDEAGHITHFVSTGKDITERMEAQEHLYYLAHHDVLTGLPNRALLQDRLAHAVAQTERSGNMLAVLFFDLDRFKNINDSLGHSRGDELLKAVAARVVECVRGGDTIARLAGDEFTVVMEAVDEVDDVSRVAEKILTAVATPSLLGGQEVFVTASIGITIYPHDARDIDGLLKNADAAMYRAKEIGGNSYQYFTSDMTVQAVERLRLRNQVHRALERGEFLVYYQPRVDLRNGHVSGVEALLRWKHPEHGLVSPTQFIPLLEETGLILRVGEWVLQTACTFNRWLSEAAGRSLRVAVNLSTRQFSDRQLVVKVRDCIEKAGLSPEFVELEITESLLADNIEQTIDTLGALRDMGLRISVDDFGTGYSSMSYLKRFPIGCLKVDRAFVRDVPGDKNDTGIVMAILALARSLALQVTAEGVETQQQLDFVREQGCNEVQGYLIGRPMPPEEVLTWVRAHPDGVGDAAPIK